VRVPSWITVELLIEQFALRYHVSAFPTHTVDGRVEGLVTLRGIRRVPANQRSQKRARDIAIPIAQVPIAQPDELLTDLLERMGPGADGRALVFDGDQLVGIISPSDLVRLLQPGAGNATKRSSAA
jgi:CBS domain-containing protein